MSPKIAVAQFSAGTNKAENRENIAALVTQAAADGSDLVVLPENAMYSPPDSTSALYPVSEDLDGNFVQFLQQLAREHSIWIVAGMTESVHSTEKVHNTVIVVDPAGELQGAYRKIHLYDAFGYRESDAVQAGELDDPTTFTVDGTTFGLLTCYDLRFPESARRLVDAGAEVILIPAAWVAGPLKEEHWSTLIRARAIENTVYVAAAGQTGPICIGRSVIVDPSGVIKAEAGPRPGLVSHELSSERLAEVRASVPVLEHRRFYLQKVNAHD
ncbi:carbon-nitrogen hydrolase family protein [Arthrobacter sp. StoSoilB5]|uniref:carbon-nitrogen hydrolase family protein n=1 Tax=Arthrobacter sp. StoSoilB5 TaxID=2830992 RepID=UPI001CC581A0|nr:carbon-nitrogen hydrolase family protein [Arthrobacter sp. StoSoilB5]BCW44896.1 hydrolase [Arthrobacter sp. StoSoilB5]